MISYLPTKFVGNKSSESENIAYLICHVTPQYHVIKESCHFKDGAPQGGGHKSFDNGYMFLNYHAILWLSD